MLTRALHTAATLLTVSLVAAPASLASGQASSQSGQTPPPAPRPFPGAAPPSASTPAKPQVKPPEPSIAELGNASVMPNAEFLESIDAGRGQRILLYGTNMPFDQVLTYYKASLRGASGRELFREPLMYQFDLGRFDERTMTYPPSVVVKDYSAAGSNGYLHVAGTVEKRYRTIIQIVPVAPGVSR